MITITPSETLKWLENQKEDIDIWYSKNSMKWRIRKEQIGLFSGETISEAVCEAMIVSNNRHMTFVQNKTAAKRHKS